MSSQAPRRNVFLIGPMGSGKTAVGKQLARLLDLTFYDSDAEIERRTGVDIPYIFEKEGETGFRERERDVIDSLTQLQDVVIATGGGAVLLPENRERLAARGRVVYLRTGIRQQLERTRHGRQRPLLYTADPETRLRELMEVRAPLYESIASVVVATDGRHVRIVADDILERLQGAARDMSAPLHERVDIALGERSYPILIGPRSAGRCAAAEHAHRGAQSADRHQRNDRAALSARSCRTRLQGRRVATLILPDGEQHKTLESFSRILDALVAERMNRDAAAVALGGGVIGDMAGFAAACYQRGIDYVQVPTTLLAQVDSSVGGKTGVNHPRGKNMIGAFHQPRCVLADTSTLQTLPPREYRAGLAEVVKYGFIRDAAFLQWLEANVERSARARGRSSDSRGPPLLRDQGGGRRPGRARARPARDPESRPHLRPRDRDRRRATATGCTAKRWPQAW